MSIGRVVRGVTCLWDKFSMFSKGEVIHGEYYPWGALYGASCLWCELSMGELSMGRAFHGENYPWGELSMGQVVHEENCP
jgi:hypothetical protein